MSSNERIGLFVGSFDPFTVGHHSIVQRALPLFNRIVIGVGVNSMKKYMFSEEERIQNIATLYAHEPQISVKAYHALSIEFAKREHANFFIKGARSVKDFEYEREQAEINKQIGGIDTILLYTEPQFASVSSTLVRELLRFGGDVSAFLPHSPQSKKESI